jgi:hypothetical protein
MGGGINESVRNLGDGPKFVDARAATVADFNRRIR